MVIKNFEDAALGYTTLFNTSITVVKFSYADAKRVMGDQISINFFIKPTYVSCLPGELKPSVITEP